MMWIVRWPLVLVLLVLVVASLFPAALTTISQTNLPIDLGPLADELATLGATPSWIEAGLWYGAALFFLIAAIRLMRRTQAFWAWLLAFALYGGRWALTQQTEEGGALEAVAELKADDFQPEALMAGGTSAQVSLLGVILVVGVLIFLVDMADRNYWDKHGA